MAEKENCPEIFSSIQDNPDGSVSMSEQPTANSIDGSVSISEQPTANSIIVQALVTNQSALAAISEAILSANKPVLTEHVAPENTSQAVAEPSTNKTNISDTIGNLHNSKGSWEKW